MIVMELYRFHGHVLDGGDHASLTETGNKSISP